MRHDAALNSLSGVTLIKIYFSVPSLNWVISSQGTVKSQITIEFSRSILPNFLDGFAADLGTGLPHKSEIACKSINLNLIPGVDHLSCVLIYGTYPNPT